MDDKITDKRWIFLLGWIGLVFAVYPMTKDYVENVPKTVYAMVLAIIFSFLLVLGFFFFFPKSEQNPLDSSQQLVENMDINEKQIESKDIRNIFETALKKHDISFLDNFKDKNNLKYIQKLAELEISKIYSDLGTQFTIVGLGLALFIVGSGNLANSPNFVLLVWIIAGIIIIILGFSWDSLSRRIRIGGKIDFLNNIILQVERKLP